MNMQHNHSAIMPDGDLAYTILSDLKRVTREYATAATESSCQNVRQMFTNLMDNTLRMQGELYTIMQSNNMYNASSPALRQEVDKQIKSYQQTQQKTNQFLQQKRNAQPWVQQGMMSGYQQQPPSFNSGNYM
jgi:spore coat protein CotF